MRNPVTNEKEHYVLPDSSCIVAGQLRIRAEANTLADELLVGFSSGAGNGYDPSEDALFGEGLGVGYYEGGYGK